MRSLAAEYQAVFDVPDIRGSAPELGDQAVFDVPARLFSSRST
jgi:hypothetical protein